MTERSSSPSGTPNAGPVSESIEQRLDRLERESVQRQRELRELAGQLPAALSRRRLLIAAVGDIRRAPNKAELVQRGARKVGRAPASLVRRLGSRRS